LVSATLVYFLHAVLNAEILAIVLFLVSAILVILDQPRKYFYVFGLVSYPLFTAISAAAGRDQSLYPLVVFFEVANVAMILFGSYLGTKTNAWIKSLNANN